MKKRYILLLAALVLLTWPVTTFAADDAASPELAAATVSLELDNTRVYDGMNKAYKDGYMPTIKNGIATIVLPLMANGTIEGNTITVTPGLGEPASSPFVYSNYQKSVALADNAVAGGKTVAGYLVRFDLPLNAGRTNGVYAVTVDVAAKAADLSPIRQSFTAYVTITGGKDPNAAQATPKPEKPTSQPKIIVGSYAVNPSPAMAGEQLTATITLENTSKTKGVQNMAVTVSCDSPNFSLQNDSNTLFIGKLGKGATTEIAVTYKTDLATPPQRYNIVLAIEYDNSDATTLSAAGTVPVTISQPLRVELEKPQIPDSVNAGDTMPLTLQVMNMGRGKVYNVRIDLSAPGLIPTRTAFIGNMEAGTAAQGQMDVFVGTKDMTEGYEGNDKYGLTSGKLTLTYEDEGGKQYTQDMELSTTINEPVITPVSAKPQEEPEKASQWWISIVAGIVVIGGLAALLIVRGKRRIKNNEDI